MTETIYNSLRITMASIAVIAFMFLILWLLLWSMLSLPINRSRVRSEKGNEVLDQSKLLLKKAAAAAVLVALQRSNHQISLPMEDKLPPLVSPWQLGMRTRQMLQKSNFRNRS